MYLWSKKDCTYNDWNFFIGHRERVIILDTRINYKSTMYCSPWPVAMRMPPHSPDLVREHNLLAEISPGPDRALCYVFRPIRPRIPRLLHPMPSHHQNILQSSTHIFNNYRERQKEKKYITNEWLYSLLLCSQQQLQ